MVLGANRSGRLGDGEAVGSDEVGEFSDAPVAVGGGHRFVGISADKDLTCAIDTDGRAWCWGAYWFDTYEPNPSGSIGSTPVEVAGGHDFTAVSVGGRGVCALDKQGRAWCWGKYAWPPDSEEQYDWDNYDWDTPTETAVGRTFSTITVGGDHTCGIDTSGSAWCWGSDSAGERGDGDPLRPVAGAQLFQKLGVGVDASCALDDHGSAWCWGRGGEVTDETGETTTTTMAAPQRVAGDNRFASISAGGFQTCAIGEAGTTWCWTPGDDRPLDSPVPGGHEFATISVGAAQACAVDSGARVWCWCTGEAGNLGLLGNGDTGECSASSPVPLAATMPSSPSRPGRAIPATGHRGSGMVLGDDSSGQIGDGDASTDTRFEPALVTGAHAFTALSVGRGHTCGLDTTGRAWCWGWDGWGQLGDGDTSQESRTSPAPVAGGHTFTAISAGAYHTCALDRNGQPWCWGSDELGQLSDRDPFRVNKSAPVHVATP